MLKNKIYSLILICFVAIACVSSTKQDCKHLNLNVRSYGQAKALIKQAQFKREEQQNMP